MKATICTRSSFYFTGSWSSFKASGYFAWKKQIVE